MKLSILIICSYIIAACNNSNLQTQKVVVKSVHIPDTTNNWYAKRFDYPSYVTKSEIGKQLNIDNLETDTSKLQIRIWTIGSNYNPQTLISLKTENNIWTISKLEYYLSLNNEKTKVDSVLTNSKFTRTFSPDNYILIETERIWELPSQSEMKNGVSFGCNDGYSLLIEMSNKTKYKFSSYRCPDFHVSKDTTFQSVISFVQRIEEALTKK